MTAIRGIKKELLQLLLELGKNSHPNEFAALLKEEDGVIAELNPPPRHNHRQFLGLGLL